MDTHASLANTDSNKTQPTKRDVLLLQNVLDQTKLLVLETLKAAMHAEPVLLHSSHNLTDLDASDQDQSVDVLKSMTAPVMSAFNAQLVKYLMTPDLNATQLQLAMDQDRSLVTLQTATDARLAHQTSCQMPTEEHVLDQFQSAHALKDTLPTVMSANNAQIDRLLTQLTTRDASQDNAIPRTRSLPTEINATDASNAHQVINQAQTDLSAIESSQSAAALSNMTLLDMSACHAHHTKLLPTTTRDAFQDNAQDSMKFLVLLINAMPVKNARRDLPQITSEEDAWDTSLPHAHATRDLMTMVTDVSTAHKVLDHPLITDHAWASTATRTKSWEEISFAHNVNGAHQAPSQIQRERTVSSSQDHQSPSTVSQLVTNTQFSTWTDQSALSAQTTWRHQRTTLDVWTHALIHLILSKRMEPASPAAMVTYQTTAEPDVSRRATTSEDNVLVIEKSTTATEQDVPLVTHIPEPKDQTPSASLINALPTKSLHG